MNTTGMHGGRNDWLHVRLTAEEAQRVAQVAAMRGLSVSAYVRKAVLRGSGRLTEHRTLRADTACTVRELSAIAADLRRLALSEATAIAGDEVHACLTAVRAALDRLA